MHDFDLHFELVLRSEAVCIGLRLREHNRLALVASVHDQQVSQHADSLEPWALDSQVLDVLV